jgi:mono/diheme cytochrome c family protein
MSTANARPRRTRPTAAPWRRRALRSAAPWAGAAALLVKAGPTPAQDAERGVRLFYATRSETGRPVGNCVACHASGEALILETAVVMAAKQRRSSVGAAFRATLATAEQF